MKERFLSFLGVFLFLGMWYLASLYLKSQPEYQAFHSFGPVESLQSLGQLIIRGEIWSPLRASLSRVFWGIFWAMLFGIPLGLFYGYLKVFRSLTNIPFQFLRMISPLSWMPLAILFFPNWDSSIIFLVTMATIWPILFATSSGVGKINYDWLLLGKNMGAHEGKMLLYIILPAVLPDILAGLRLAVGVAWIVIVPSEYLGVTSGLGYAINDARDTINYSKLVAWVMTVGIVGYSLDKLVAWFIGQVSWHTLEKREKSLFILWFEKFQAKRKRTHYTPQEDYQI